VEWVCRIVDVIISIAPVVAVVVAAMALSQAKKIANRQMMLMEYEWLPYLSYEKMHAQMIPGIAGIVPSFHMILKNNGRCIVQYEIKKFEVSCIVHYSELVQSEDSVASIPTLKTCTLELRDSQPESDAKGVVGINSELVQACGDFQFHDENGIIKNSLTPYVYQFRISFDVAYGKKGDAENKYTLKYIVDMIYKDEKFVEKMSWCDIVGY